MNVSTVPGFPRLMQASITLQEFHYRVYMPEIPIQEPKDDGYRNYFASTINFATMRYYYQRAIRNGQDIALKNLAYNSKEHIEATLGNKTTLVPMKFQDPSIKFFIANEEYLKKLLQTSLKLCANRMQRLFSLQQRSKQPRIWQ